MAKAVSTSTTTHTRRANATTRDADAGLDTIVELSYADGITRIETRDGLTINLSSSELMDLNARATALINQHLHNFLADVLC